MFINKVFLIVAIFICVPTFAQEIYFCPMHPQIQKYQSGNCPICSLQLMISSKNQTIFTCSMHPQIKIAKSGKCPICFMELVPYVLPPPFPTNVLLTIKNSWISHNDKKKLANITKKEYVTKLVYEGAKSNNYNEQIEAITAILSQCKGKEFSDTVKRIFAQKKYKLMDIAAYFVGKKKRIDLLPTLIKFIEEKDYKACQDYLDPHLSIAWCLAHFKKNKQAIAIFQQHLLPEARYKHNLLMTLLFLNKPEFDKLLILYLKKINDKTTTLYFENFLKAKEKNNKAFTQVVKSAFRGNVTAQMFLEKIFPKSAYEAHKQIFYYAPKKFLTDDLWHKMVNSALYLAKKNDPNAIKWLVKQLHSHQFSHKLNFLTAVTFLHPKIKKTLYKLLSGHKNDFYIACALFKTM